MVKTRESLLDTATALEADHDCPYAERLLNVDRQQQIGSSGIRLATLASLLTELEEMHSSGNCPPTHVGAGPTNEWANWVKDVQR